MTRDRKVVCGYKPTNPNAAPTTASAQKLDKNVVFIEPAAPANTATARPKPATTTTTRPKTTTTAAKPKTTTTATVKPKTKPRTSTTTAATTTTAAAPTTSTKPKSKTPWWAVPPATSKTTTSAPATTTSAPAATTTTTATAKTRRTLDSTPRQSGIDAQCRGGVQGSYAVRCGPQSELPYTPGTGNPTAPPPRIIYNRQGASLYAPSAPAPGTVVREGDVASNVRVIPRHLYENYQYAQASQLETTVPDGYARVFDDGRLNPDRAVMTFAGKAATDSVWTEKVPRRVRDDAAPIAVVSTQSSSTSPAAPVISTKSAAPEKSLRVSGRNYVQAATYTDPAVAQSTARKLRGLGMPVEIGKYDKNGRTYRMVLAGPFADAASADRAATKVRGAGYSDAFVR